ncbi:FAD dependent oxidoreductase domain-containing protein [Colletotrichum paranaense]|uniref:FAD dependent oxidoreductase domain-containing protein n=1 Tax=Colletotrichum paranaense TaxID=1914294 RepID=A0ABQ9S838_9PEZI|nr:FAD dependent oxidoreductase domain-containing protein [Colletotrichum paranaense]KAK1529468.1 FAD dependent oxidoreductase domain-containing protein [Colletotrichum paranaense]
MMQEAGMVNALLRHFKYGPQQKARDEATRPEVEGRKFASSPNQCEEGEGRDGTFGVVIGTMWVQKRGPFLSCLRRLEVVGNAL